ncbi:YcjX family GTP-binding protein [Pseudoalteromonas xiamenensis]
MSRPQIYLKQFLQTAEKVVQRGLDKHVKIAVTGFSGSGKTAFITSFIRQLTTQATNDNLPFFDVVKSGRFIACKQISQDAMSVPSFDYQSAIKTLLATEPNWPSATKRINTISLALKYYAKEGLRAQLSPESTLYIELYDYPGEWLIDLPLLNQDYETWSREVLKKYRTERYHEFANAFLQQIHTLDATQDSDDNLLAEIASIHGELLCNLKANTPAILLQPGRQILPGDLAGAPMLSFFPCEKPHSVEEGCIYEQLDKRFEAYKEHVVKPFYKDYFCQFDRQVVLMDAFSALQGGYDYLSELQSATQQMLSLFDYGKNHWLRRLWLPKIDKVLFAANKCDMTSSNQHSNLVRLLDSLLQDSQNTMKFDHVNVDTMATSSVRSSLDRQIQENSKKLNCVYGKPIGEQEWVTYLPSAIPPTLLRKEQWPDGGFEFLSFTPLAAKEGRLEHIRMDHALQFLLGDKLR